MSSFVLCVGCGAQLYGFSPCQWCTCRRCGNDLRNGFCSLCNSGNSYVYDPNPNSFDCLPDSYHPPHPTYETYSYDSYGNDSQFGYDCQPQFPLHYESEPGYNENYNSYPYDSSSLPQKYPYCTHCGGPHETCQCDKLIFDEPYSSPPDSELFSSDVMEIVTLEVGGIEASNDNSIPVYDPIISGTPPNLTPSGESDFFLEVDAFLAVEDEPTSS
nr:pre-mRNA splicing Prp18-interacting factor [Tanacetum cinerariifolium]